MKFIFASFGTQRKEEEGDMGTALGLLALPLVCSC